MWPAGTSPHSLLAVLAKGQECVVGHTQPCEVCILGLLLASQW